MQDTSYFKSLEKALVQAGLYKPTLVIDRNRLDANLETISSAIPSKKFLRLVDKSLTSLSLLNYVMDKWQTHKIMSFHLPLAQAVLKANPTVEILFGKPMPVKALEVMIKETPATEVEHFFRQTTWLIDSCDRFKQYQRLAQRLNRPMQFVFEVNIGLCRGGFNSITALTEAIASLGQSSLVTCKGLMGYDAQVAELPRVFGGLIDQMAKADERLDAYVTRLPPCCRQIINTGGSKTILYYSAETVANELSVGSALLKPTDFDLPHLENLFPAVFIATPILKVVDACLPGPPCLTKTMQLLRQFPQQGCFIYGGQWLAKPVYPEGLALNRLWGESSNQQFMRLPKDHNTKVDDFVFFRPNQSEALLQQFGDIAVYGNGEIEGFWSPLLV